MQEDVHAQSPLGKGAAQVRANDVERRPDVLVIVECQLCRLRRRYDAAQQADGIGIGGGHLVGEVVGKQSSWPAADRDRCGSA
jgi:hypothetical protein